MLWRLDLMADLWNHKTNAKKNVNFFLFGLCYFLMDYLCCYRNPRKICVNRTVGNLNPTGL